MLFGSFTHKCYLCRADRVMCNLVKTTHRFDQDVWTNLIIPWSYTVGDFDRHWEWMYSEWQAEQCGLSYLCGCIINHTK